MLFYQVFLLVALIFYIEHRLAKKVNVLQFENMSLRNIIDNQYLKIPIEEFATALYMPLHQEAYELLRMKIVLEKEFEVNLKIFEQMEEKELTGFAEIHDDKKEFKPSVELTNALENWCVLRQKCNIMEEYEEKFRSVMADLITAKISISESSLKVGNINNEIFYSIDTNDENVKNIYLRYAKNWESYAWRDRLDKVIVHRGGSVLGM